MIVSVRQEQGGKVCTVFVKGVNVREEIQHAKSTRMSCIASESNTTTENCDRGKDIRALR